MELEWNAKFDKAGREGREVPIGKEFYWDGCRCTVPAAYVCDEGLILDWYMEIDRETYRAFLEKWRHLFEREGQEGMPTRQEWREFHRENPAENYAQNTVYVNGRKLKYECGTGYFWVPESLRPIMCDRIDSKPFMTRYGLDAEAVWQCWREKFRWDEAGAPELESLDLELRQMFRDAFPSTTFQTPKAGEQVTIFNPVTGCEHIVTVLDVRQEKRQLFRQEGMRFPEHCTVMTYTLKPEVPKDAFYLGDTVDSDRPIQTGEGKRGDVTAVASNCKKPKSRWAVSAMHFAPVENVTWQAVFRAKSCEDITVRLL